MVFIFDRDLVSSLRIDLGLAHDLYIGLTPGNDIDLDHPSNSTREVRARSLYICISVQRPPFDLFQRQPNFTPERWLGHPYLYFERSNYVSSSIEDWVRLP